MIELPEYKLIVAGGRDFDDYARLQSRLNAIINTELQTFKVSIVCGMARGADYLGYKYAKGRGLTWYEYPAKWEDLDVPGARIKYNSYGAYNANAGHDRNQLMADVSDGLLAFWDGKSKGTRNMIALATDEGLEVEVIRY